MLNNSDEFLTRDEIIQQIKIAGNSPKAAVKAIITFVPTGEIRKINPSANKILREISSKSLKTGDSIFLLFSTSHLLKFNEQLRSVLSSGIINSDVVYNGEKSNFTLSLLPVYDLKGSVDKINLVFSSRSQSPSEHTGESLLTQSNLLPVASHISIAETVSRLKHITEQSSDLICAIDVEGNFTEVNLASLTQLGYKPEELIGKPYLNYVHPEDISKTKGTFSDIKKGKETSDFTNRYISKIGEIVSLTWSCRWDPEEKEIFCISRALENEMQETPIIRERSMLKTIIDNIPDAIFAVNEDHQTILTNKKFYSSYLGKTSEIETLGLQPVDYFPVEKGRQIMEDNQKVMESGKPVINRRDVVYDHLGNKEVILLTKVPFESKDEEKAGLVGIARNITASYNYEEEQKFINRLNKTIGKTPGHRKALKKTIKLMAEFFGFSVAEAWEVGFDKENIRKVAGFYQNKNEVWDDKLIFKKNIGLPGSTWKSKKLQIWPDLQNEKRFQRLDLIKGSDIFMGVGVPVILKDEVIAVLVFFGAKDKVQINLKKVLERIAIQLATEVKRKMTENQLNNMFEFSPNLIAVIGIDGYLKKVNPAFFKIFGYTEDELLKTPFTEFLHPEEKGNTYERLKEVAGGLNPRPFTNRCLSKSGEWRWISWTPSDLIEEEGIVHLFGIDITPIKTLNLELLQYRNLIESLNDGVVFISLDPERVILNSAYKKIVGLPQEGEYSRSEMEKLYANRKTARKIFSTLLAGDYFEGDIQLKNGEGEMLDFNLRGGPVLSEKGELIAVFGLHTDISERKRYETSLKTYGNRITNILESITDGFFSLNNDWEVTYWNKEAENLALVKRETIINENIWNHLPEAKKLLFYTKFNEAKDKNVKVGFEEYFELLGKWFDLSAYPGKEGLSVYFRDVTEKKKIDEQIRIAKERYDLVAKATREAVYDWNILENHLEWSDVYYNIYGYDKTGKFETLENWEKNLHPEDREEVVDHLIKCVNSTKVKWEHEYRLIKKNKQIASVLERGFIVRDNKGKAVRMIGALQDITEIKQTEIALEELNFQLQKHAGDLAVSNAELEQFAYIASHDLQEPLRMVTSFLTQLQRKYNDQLDDKARQYIHFATDGAVRMRQIILDLLEYSRVGKLDYNFEKIDLNVMLQEISQLHKNLILERSATIKYENLPVINAAVTPLQRVLSNLITNSIKYNQEKPIVQISANEKPKHWQIDVNDNGIGIDEKFQEKVFIIFQRLHSREQYSGTGMGLAICKKIIENHGGKIWVTSKEGEGSTFHFTILKQF